MDALQNVNNDEALKNERIDAAIALMRAAVPAAEADAVEVFGREYYRQVDPDDVIERSPEEIMGALLSHWQFGARREPGKPKVRVLSPTVADSGWASRHSVIEIVNDDMPFLVDSVTMELARRGSTLHLIVHPIFAVQRNADGTLVSASGRGQAPDAPRESWMHVEIDRLVDAQQRADVVEDLERVLADVRAAVTDWRPMVARLNDAMEELAATAPPVPADELAESLEFLRWLAQDHLLLLGYRAARPGGPRGRRLAQDGAGQRPRPAARQRRRRDFRELRRIAALCAGGGAPGLAGADRHQGQYALDRASPRLHRLCRREALRQGRQRRRRAPLRRPADLERVCRARCTRFRCCAARSRRSRRRRGCRRADTSPRRWCTSSRPTRATSCSRSPTAELHEIALGILQLGERQRMRLFIRRDPYERFVSCLVYVPRETYSTDLRRKFQEILTNAFNGLGADFDVLLSDTILARIHFTVRTLPGQDPAVRPPQHREEACRRGTALGRRAAQRADRRPGRSQGHRAVQALDRRPSRSRTASGCCPARRWPMS